MFVVAYFYNLLLIVCCLFVVLASILEPVPVMVVQVDVSLILSSLNISWIDEINMNDVSYIVSYNITVGTVSLSADLAVLGGNDTSLNVTDLAVVRGVTVNVTIIVNNTLGLLSEERTFDVAVEGGLCVCTYRVLKVQICM